MMNKIITFFGIFFLIVISGCTKSGEAPAKSPFIGGSQGIVAEFQVMGLEEEGTETVFEKEPFNVIVTLKNKGEAEVDTGKAKVTIKGVDTGLFGITDDEKKNKVKLEKISEFNKLGGEEDIDFGKAKLESITGTFYDATFFANIDYDYTTFVSIPRVCFKYDLKDDTICDVEGSKTVYSSSAPIQVRSVREDPAGNRRIALIFDIENVGGGKATLINSKFLFRYNRIGFELSEPWDCKASGSNSEIRFTDNKATLRCISSSLEKGTLFTKQLSLKLNYLYRDIIQKTLRIKELANE